MTALMLASKGGHTNIVEALLSVPTIDVNMREKKVRKRWIIMLIRR